MDPLDLLTREHQKILQVVTCLERLVWTSGDRGRIGDGSARDLIRFFREYGDGLHRTKEEEIYYPALNRTVLSTGDLVREHTEFRFLLGIMELAVPDAAMGVPEALDKFSRAADQFLFTLRRHIRKEDHFVFPVGHLSLSAEERSDLGQRFEEFERNHADRRAELLALADRLLQEFGVARDRN